MITSYFDVFLTGLAFGGGLFVWALIWSIIFIEWGSAEWSDRKSRTNSTSIGP